MQQERGKKGSIFSTSRELTGFYILLSLSQFPLTATILSSQEKVYLCETTRTSSAVKINQVISKEQKFNFCSSDNLLQVETKIRILQTIYTNS